MFANETLTNSGESETSKPMEWGDNKDVGKWIHPIIDRLIDKQ